MVRQPLAHIDVDAPINLALAGATSPRVLDRPLKVDFVADSLPLDALPRFTDRRVQCAWAHHRRGCGSRHGNEAGACSASSGSTSPRSSSTALGVTARDMGGLIHMTGKEIIIDTLGAKSGEGTLTNRRNDRHHGCRESEVRSEVRRARTPRCSTMTWVSSTPTPTSR